MSGNLVGIVVGVGFTDTVNLGTGLLAAVIAIATIGRLIYTVPKTAENASLRRQLQESRGEVEDKTRRLRELGSEKDRLQQIHAAAEQRAATLQETIDAMPKYEDVIEAMRIVGEQAQVRQEQFLSVVLDRIEKHDEVVRVWHDEQLTLMRAILNELKHP